MARARKIPELEQTLVVTDRDYLPVLLALLENAQSRIDVLAFSFAIGSARGVIAEASAPYAIAKKLAEMKRRRKSKLRIRVYLEGHRETAPRTRITGEYLKRAGAAVVYGSTHAKGFLIDDRYVLFGSTNLTEQSVRKNHEANLCFDEPTVARGFGKYFDHLWAGGGHGGVRLRSPMLADAAFKDALVEMIDAAESRLDFSIYFFHHSEIENAILRAHRRGVKIRGVFHDHASFALAYVRRTRGTAERLRAAGIRGIRFGPNHLFTHSKFLVRDREEVALGTGNWIHEDVKVHPQLYTRFANREVARSLAKEVAKIPENLRRHIKTGSVSQPVVER